MEAASPSSRRHTGYFGSSGLCLHLQTGDCWRKPCESDFLRWRWFWRRQRPGGRIIRLAGEMTSWQIVLQPSGNRKRALCGCRVPIAVPRNDGQHAADRRQGRRRQRGHLHRTRRSGAVRPAGEHRKTGRGRLATSRWPTRRCVSMADIRGARSTASMSSSKSSAAPLSDARSHLFPQRGQVASDSAGDAHTRAQIRLPLVILR